MFNLQSEFSLQIKILNKVQLGVLTVYSERRSVKPPSNKEKVEEILFMLFKKELESVHTDFTQTIRSMASEPRINKSNQSFFDLIAKADEVARLFQETYNLLHAFDTTKTKIL